MQTQHRDRPVLSGIAAVARALATAILSLTLGATLCLGLLLGGGVLPVAEYAPVRLPVYVAGRGGAGARGGDGAVGCWRPG